MELTELPVMERSMAKNEMRNFFYNYQMAEWTNWDDRMEEFPKENSSLLFPYTLANRYDNLRGETPPRTSTWEFLKCCIYFWNVTRCVIKIKTPRIMTAFA